MEEVTGHPWSDTMHGPARSRRQENTESELANRLKHRPRLIFDSNAQTVIADKLLWEKSSQGRQGGAAGAY